MKLMAAQVSQTDTIVSQKEGTPESTEVLYQEVPQMNVEKQEKESPDGKTRTADKGTEGSPTETSEVGLKKFFRLVGLKFTLKKDKSEETEPQKEPEEDKGETSSSKGGKDSEGEITMDEKKQPVEETEAGGTAAEPIEDLPSDKDGGDAADLQEATAATEATMEVFPKSQADTNESHSSPPQDTQFTLKRFFTQGIFSSLQKTKSSTKPTEEELQKENTAEKETEENAELSTDESEKTTIEATEEPQSQQEEATMPEASELVLIPERVTVSEETVNFNENKTHQIVADENADTVVAEATNDIKCAEDEDDIADEETSSEDDFPGMSFEAELLSSIEKQIQRLPFKKLFTGTCRMRFSAKKQIDEEEAEQRLSPEESEENFDDLPVQLKRVYDTDEGNNVVADEEKKTDAILHWTSLKKLITPMKRVQKSPESEEASNLIVTEDEDEMKPNDDDQETELSTEEPKKKTSSSVSWESLICVGSAKKRARKHSGGGEEKPVESQDLVKEPELENYQVEYEQLSPGKAEGNGGSTWVSLKKLIPGHKKKKSEGQQALSDEAGNNAVLVETESVPSVHMSELTQPETVLNITLIEDVPQKQADLSEEVATEDTTGKIPSEELSETNKTPCVTTEVPKEYDVEQEGAVLYEAVESVIPVVLPVTLAEKKGEVVLISVSSEVLESFTKEKTTVLVAHEKSDASAICTGLESKDIVCEPVEEVMVKPSVESILEAAKVVSTKMTSGKPQAAETSVDDNYEACAERDKTLSQEAGAQAQEILEEDKKSQEQNAVEEVDSRTQIEVKEHENERVNDLQEAVPVQVPFVSSGEGEAGLEAYLTAEDTPEPVAEEPIVSTADELDFDQSTNAIEMSSAGEKYEDHIKDSAGDALVVEAVTKSDIDVALADVSATVEDVSGSVEKAVEESVQATTTEEQSPTISSQIIKETVEVLSEPDKDFNFSNVHLESEDATAPQEKSLATTVITMDDKTEKKEVSEPATTVITMDDKTEKKEVSETETIETGIHVLEENIHVREASEDSKKAAEDGTEEEVRVEAKERAEHDKSQLTKELDSHEEKDVKVKLKDEGLETTSMEPQAMASSMDEAPFELVSVRDVSSQTDEVEVSSNQPDKKEDLSQDVATEMEEGPPVELQESEDVEKAVTATSLESNVMEAVVTDSQCQVLPTELQNKAVREEENQDIEQADIVQRSAEKPQQNKEVPGEHVGSATAAMEDMQNQEAMLETKARLTEQ
ncbi:A-kinase anchor protein 12-like [Arapaima gigas]